jgi:hypothetical protein
MLDKLVDCLQKQKTYKDIFPETVNKTTSIINYPNSLKNRAAGAPLTDR